MFYAPFQNKSVQRLKGLKVAILSLDLTCSGLLTHSGKFLITGASRKKKPVESLPEDECKKM